MQCKFSKIALSGFFLFALLPSTLAAGWFGPKNYEDCVLDNMKGVESDKAAILISKSCHLKFPEKKNYFDRFDNPPVNHQSKSITYLRQATRSEKIKFWSELSGELNKNFPMPVDSETVAFNSAPLEDGIRWNYQMVNVKSSDQPSGSLDDILKQIKTDSIARFCTTPDSLFFREANADIQAYYYGNDGGFIGKISFKAGSGCKAITFGCRKTVKQKAATNKAVPSPQDQYSRELSRYHTDGQRIVSTQAFWNWVDGQPVNIRSDIRSAQRSGDARMAADVISMYKAEVLKH